MQRSLFPQEEEKFVPRENKKLKRVKFKNKFSWSFSRDNLFCDCARAYYYYYYASWGGWEKDADSFARKAYQFKNMKNVDLWAGEVVHKVIQWILESKKIGKTPQIQDALSRVDWLFDNGLKQSINRLWESNVKNNLNLFEHYYLQEYSQAQLEEKFKHKTRLSLENFYQSKFLEKLDSLGIQAYLQVEELGNFIFEQVTIYAVPDFAFKENNLYYLYDWKTGKPDSNVEIQLACYALYAIEKWKISQEEIKIAPVYLAFSPVVYCPLDKIKIQEVKEYIRNSVFAMTKCLVDQDRDNNIINKEKCVKTDFAWRCKRCFFQEICK